MQLRSYGRRRRDKSLKLKQRGICALSYGRLSGLKDAISGPVVPPVEVPEKAETIPPGQATPGRKSASILTAIKIG
jgi:hypothetical protein